MNNIKKSFKQINTITKILLQNTLLKTYNFPIEKNKELVWENFSGIFYQLKQDEYNNIYNKILNDNNCNFIFLDWAIIQMMYRFSNCWTQLLSHRLAFYPKITNEQLWESPDEYEENFYWLRSFWDLSYKDNISAPLRFDYDIVEWKFQERFHSYSHFTIWWYKNCRVTVSSPLTPFQFISFILKSFYSEKTIELDLLNKFKDNLKFDETITINEKEDVYISI